ncbi:multicopper oxidase domain-containing protein [Flavobacterium sp. F372]|uniref:Multicopper oxidase domain-containing protein n=1 Tax=Flavobacterium bernardetii TaxID=2813823 RepID=A0ABR7J032_9FLAO|nr:multicopper oxidase domain-containing protein [Flavobacterium bernardetii]MBC5835385.1 multicopper oxidase domain-containing protein [Flavobacterium bernardetii]NHF69729.1 multicopper oxidase domain-containing protein [Flavobacterium bernardetii]
MRSNKGIVFGIIVFFMTVSSSAQKEILVIGRTTGELVVNKNKKIRSFGFSSTLSGQVSLPGSPIEMIVGDSLTIDFWNISQGNPVSLFAEGINFKQLDEENKIIKNKPVAHMEHGLYRILAKNTGTYLYYSPENYPFNLQAGMFGIINIREKEKLESKKTDEVVWCSHEIDTNWHTDDIMNENQNAINNPFKLLEYQPNYFLINGKLAKKTNGLQPLNLRKDTIILRIVNAGLYNHEIEFPVTMHPEIIFGNTSNSIKTSETTKVVLHSKETMEIQLFLVHSKENESIVYNYIDPKIGKVIYKVKIPVFY